MEPQTQKQQITDILRNADNVVVTTSKDPDIDQVAAAIALTHIINKLGKRADAVVSGDRPPQIEFLGAEGLAEKFSGIRDFVISVNTSRTEADKLKYVPEGKALNIYITPYNGNYKEDDVSFHYGDFHADAVVALGVSNPKELDSEIAGQKELLQKSRLITINVGNPPASQAGPPAAGQASQPAELSWHEPNASSVCELLMNLTEALQSGLVNDEIATALLTGIMAKTEHFTNAATTPKVMTMAAQLMAAGAQQPEILKNLQSAPAGKTARKIRPAKLKGELEPAKEQQLQHRASGQLPQPKPQPAKKPPISLPTKVEMPQPVAPAPIAPPSPPKPLPPLPVQGAAAMPTSRQAVPPPSPPKPTPPLAPPPSSSPPLAPPAPAETRREMVIEPPHVPEPPSKRSPTTIQPPRPAAVSQVQPESRLGDTLPAPPPPSSAIPPLTHNVAPGTAESLPPPSPPAPEPPHMDIEAARKAVEEAANIAPAPPTPGAPPAADGQPSQQ